MGITLVIGSGAAVFLAVLSMIFLTVLSVVAVYLGYFWLMSRSDRKRRTRLEQLQQEKLEIARVAGAYLSQTAPCIYYRRSTYDRLKGLVNAALEEEQNG